jgi:ATP-dependent DNA helicase RecQ
MLPEKLVKKKGIWDLKYLYIPISILNLLNYLFEVNGEDYSLLSENNTNNGKIYSIEVVWKFVKAVNGEIGGSQVDNLKHLRGACMRILRSNSDNAALNLLKVCSLFILAGNNEKLFPEASDAFFKGFQEFRIFYKDYSTPDRIKVATGFETDLS